MEHNHGCFSPKNTRKRKMTEENDRVSCIALDDLNQDVLERVLSWLPTSSFIRLSTVSKRWKSMAASPSFRVACSQVPTRNPWFFMVDPLLNQSIVFDMDDKSWKHLDYPLILLEKCNPVPVAASGGLVCFRSIYGDFAVCNPITGACRELPPLSPIFKNQPLHAISMTSSSNNSIYKLMLVLGDLPNLHAKVYDSKKNFWGEDIMLSGKQDNSFEADVDGNESNDTLYFVSKEGDIVATNMQRSPSKQYSSVITVKDGEEIINFLSSTGTIIACNLVQKCFLEYPRLLPLFLEYSIDVVECRGELLVVVLSELLETASLRIWRFSENEKSWIQLAAMPPSMSHEFYGKKADINCVGSGDQILMCVSSVEFGSCVLCNLSTNEWVQLPKYCVNGKPMEFMSALAFEPRIEVCV